LDNGKAFEHRACLYDVCYITAAHEIVLETPKHMANMADLSLAQIKV